MTVSEASDIIDVFAAMTVQYGGATPLVKAMDQALNSPTPADLPVRIILPVQPRVEASDMHFVVIGQTGTMLYRITDLLLIKPVTLGQVMIGEEMENMIDYCRRYVRRLQTVAGNHQQRTLQPEVVLINCDAQPGIWEYPVESGQLFKGVSVIMTLREQLPSTGA